MVDASVIRNDWAVGGFLSLPSNLGQQWKLLSWSTIGAEGISDGAVKCVVPHIIKFHIIKFVLMISIYINF